MAQTRPDKGRRANTVHGSWRICCLVVLSWLGSGVSSAQGQSVRIRESNAHYESGDWQSYSVARTVTSIALGHQYVYFGTLNSGIARLDQYRQTWEFPWTISNGLANNTVWVVAFDFDTGLLWCATRRTISYYSPTSRRWQNFFTDEIGIPVSDRVESIGVGKNRIVFKTRNNRLYETNKFGGVILALHRGAGDAGGGAPVRWYGKEARRKKPFPQFFMSNGYIFDPSGIIEGPNFRRAQVLSSLEDEWGNLWIGTAGLGAGRGDIQSLQLTMLPFGLANRSVRALCFLEDVLWMGGLGTSRENRGITAWDLSRDQWQTFEQRNITELYTNEINGITSNGRQVLFATNFGLTQYSPDKDRWRTFDRFDGLSDNRIFDTVVDDSSIWVATASGIDRIWKHSMLRKKDSLKVDHVIAGDLTVVNVYDLELMDNLLWAGTDNGIYVYNMNTDRGGFADEIGGPTSRVITSVSRFGDELWFGSLRGVDVYNAKQKEWLGVPAARTFPNTPINRIVAAEEAVWAATNNGVMKFDRRSKSWRRFTVEDGLLSNRVYAILLDGDYVWFGTDRGLTRFYWNSPHRID